MFFIYRLLINLVFIFSPLIIIFRIFKKKENFFRFKEKYCFFSKTRKSGKLIWFHGASVGEIQSVMPLIQKFEKDNKIKQILLTSNTLSSSKIIDNLSFKKVTHQFFPIDTNFLTKKFLNYWKPEAVFFIDSEIWPNMIRNIKKIKIPLGLINGRITKKTFNRWKKFSQLAKKNFRSFDLCLASSSESKKFLEKLGANNVNYIGNLKFSQIENEKIVLHKNIKSFISKKIVWCASSTHDNEEKICGQIHKKLKNKYNNLLTIIIPRHINRIESIKKDLIKLNLKIHLDEPKTKIKNNTDIYLVNSYGKTKSFYSICKNVFLGGSLINHGGQNPLEPARYGCNILHGPHIDNFKEIYKYLENINISKKIISYNQMKNYLEKILSTKEKNKNNQIKLNLMGKKILSLTYRNVNSLIYNDI